MSPNAVIIMQHLPIIIMQPIAHNSHSPAWQGYVNFGRGGSMWAKGQAGHVKKFWCIFKSLQESLDMIRSCSRENSHVLSSEKVGTYKQNRWSPDFFQASSLQLLKLENLLRWSHFTFTNRTIAKQCKGSSQYVVLLPSVCFCSKLI